MFYSKYRNQSSSNKPFAWNTKEGKLEQIDAGLADIKVGRVISHEEMIARYDQPRYANPNAERCRLHSHAERGNDKTIKSLRDLCVLRGELRFLFPMSAKLSQFVTKMYRKPSTGEALQGEI